MNDEAINDAYKMFSQGGYNGSINDFKQLISSNTNALNDSYNIFKSGGYNKDIASFKTLMGVGGSSTIKKKSLDGGSTSEDGSSVSPKSTRPTATKVSGGGLAEYQKSKQESSKEISRVKDLSNTAEKGSEIFTGYPGKEKNKYELRDGNWYEVNPEIEKAIKKIEADNTFAEIHGTTRTSPLGVKGGSSFARESKPKLALDAIKNLPKTIVIEDDNRIKALNQYFGKNASLNSVYEEYGDFFKDEQAGGLKGLFENKTTFDLGLGNVDKNTKYRVKNNSWERLTPNSSSYEKIVLAPSIKALNERYGKNISTDVAPIIVKPKVIDPFLVINSDFLSKTEENAQTVLAKKFGDDFKFEQTGYGTDYIKVIPRNGAESMTFSFDEKSSDEAIRLQSFLRTNASFEKGSSSAEKTIKKNIVTTRDNDSDEAPVIVNEKYYASDEYKNAFKELSYFQKRDEINRRQKEASVFRYSDVGGIVGYVKGSKEEDKKANITEKKAFNNLYNSEEFKLYDSEKTKFEQQQQDRFSLMLDEYEIKVQNGDKEGARQAKLKIESGFSKDVIGDNLKHLSNTQYDLMSKKNDLIKKAQQLEERAKNGLVSEEEYNIGVEALTIEEAKLKVSAKEVSKNQKEMNALAGVYVAEKAKYGGFGSNLWNSFVIGTNEVGDLLTSSSMSGEKAREEANQKRKSRILTPQQKKYYEDKGYSEEQIKNVLINKAQLESIKANKKAAVENLGFDLTTEESKSKLGFVQNALVGVTASLPSMILRGVPVVGQGLAFAGMANMSYNAIEEEMLNDPDFETTSKADRAVVALPYALVMGALENIGLKNMTAGKAGVAGRFILSQAAKIIPKGASREVAENIINNEVKNIFAKGGIKIVRGTLAEFETGLYQAAALDYGLKALYNELDPLKLKLTSEGGVTEGGLTGGELFDTPDTKAGVAMSILEGGVAEAIGGFAMSTMMVGAQGLINGKISLYDQNDLKFFQDFSSDEEFKKLIVSKLKDSMLEGTMTKGEAQAALNDIDLVAGVFNSIDENLPQAAKLDAFNLINEKRRLLIEIEGKDPALSKKSNDRIAEINQELEELPSRVQEDNLADRADDIEYALGRGKGTSKTVSIDGKRVSREEAETELQTIKTKLEENAIQKQAASEVLVQPTTTISEEVVQGEPTAEPQGLTEEGKAQEVEYDEFTTDSINRSKKTLEDNIEKLKLKESKRSRYDKIVNKKSSVEQNEKLKEYQRQLELLNTDPLAFFKENVDKNIFADFNQFIIDNFKIKEKAPVTQEVVSEEVIPQADNLTLRERMSLEAKGETPIATAPVVSVPVAEAPVEVAPVPISIRERILLEAEKDKAPVVTAPVVEVKAETPKAKGTPTNFSWSKIEQYDDTVIREMMRAQNAKLENLLVLKNKTTVAQKEEIRAIKAKIVSANKILDARANKEKRIEKKTEKGEVTDKSPRVSGFDQNGKSAEFGVVIDEKKQTAKVQLKKRGTQEFTRQKPESNLKIQTDKKGRFVETQNKSRVYIDEKVTPPKAEVKTKVKAEGKVEAPKVEESETEKISRGAEILKNMSEDERDNFIDDWREDKIPRESLPGGARAIILYEAKKLVPNPTSKPKRVSIDNAFSLSMEHSFVINIDGVIYGLNKYEDPDATSDALDKYDEPKQYVWAYTNINEGGEVIETNESDIDELVNEIKGSKESKVEPKVEPKAEPVKKSTITAEDRIDTNFTRTDIVALKAIYDSDISIDIKSKFYKEAEEELIKEAKANKTIFGKIKEATKEEIKKKAFDNFVKVVQSTKDTTNTTELNYSVADGLYGWGIKEKSSTVSSDINDNNIHPDDRHSYQGTEKGRTNWSEFHESYSAEGKRILNIRVPVKTDKTDTRAINRPPVFISFTVEMPEGFTAEEIANPILNDLKQYNGKATTQQLTPIIATKLLEAFKKEAKVPVKEEAPVKKSTITAEDRMGIIDTIKGDIEEIIKEIKERKKEPQRQINEIEEKKLETKNESKIEDYNDDITIIQNKLEEDLEDPEGRLADKFKELKKEIDSLKKSDLKNPENKKTLVDYIDAAIETLNGLNKLTYAKLDAGVTLGTLKLILQGIRAGVIAGKAFDTAVRAMAIKYKNEHDNEKITIAEFIKEINDYLDSTYVDPQTYKEVLEKEIDKFAEIKNAVKQAQSQSRELRKKASNTIKDMLKGKFKSISAVHMKSIMTRLVNVKVENQTQYDKFLDYVDKVIEIANYDTKVKEANAKRKNAKKNTIGNNPKLGDLFLDLLGSLSRMLNINAKLISKEVFDSYYNIVDDLSKRTTILSPGERTDLNEKVNEIVDSIEQNEEMLPDLKDAYDNYADKVVENGVVNYAKTLSQMLEDGIINNKEFTLMKKYKSKIVDAKVKVKMTPEEEAAEKAELINEITNTPITLDAIVGDEFRLERELAKRLARLVNKESLESLDNKQLKNLIKILDNINDGFVSKSTQEMVEILNEKKNSSLLVTSIPKSVKGIFKKITQPIRGVFTRDKYSVNINPLFNIDEVFGDFKTKNIFNSVLNQSAVSQQQFQSEVAEIQGKLVKAESAIASSFNRFVRNENKIQLSKFKMMVYMMQLEFESNPNSKQVHQAMKTLNATIDFAETNTETSRYSKEDIDQMKAIKKEFGKETEEFEEDGKTKKKIIDIDKLYNSFNSAEKNALKVFDEVNSLMTKKATYTATVINGNKIAPLKNYIYYNTISDSNSSEAQIDSLLNNTNPNQQKGTESKNLQERTGKVSPVDLNPFAAVNSSAKSVLVNYHMTEPIRTARKTLKNAREILEKNKKNNENVGEQFDILSVIERAYDTATKDLLETNFSESSNTDAAVQYLTKAGYRAMLGSATRALAELTSNAAFVTTNNPKDMAAGFKYIILANSGKGKNILTNLKSKVTSRNYPAGGLSSNYVDLSAFTDRTVRNGKTTTKTVNGVKQIFDFTVKKWVNLAEFTADFLIATPDKVVMKQLYFGAFSREFKKETGIEPDFEKIEANDEEYMDKYQDALEKATNQADNQTVTAGSSMNAYMGLLQNVVRKGDSGGKAAFKTFNQFMNRFTIQEYNTARKGVKALVGKGDITRAEGAQVLAAVSARMTLYLTAGKVFSEALMYLGGLVFGYGDDDDDDEKTYLQTLYQSAVSSATTLFFGRNFGNVVRSAENYFIEWGNELYGEDIGLRDGEYDSFKDALQFNQLGKVDEISDFAAIMAGPLGPVINAGTLGMKLAFKEAPKEDRAIETRRKEWYRLGLEAAGSVGLVPFYRDVRKVQMEWVYDELKKELKEKAAKKEIKDEKAATTLETKTNTLNKMKAIYKDEKSRTIINYELKKLSDPKFNEQENKKEKDEQKRLLLKYGKGKYNTMTEFEYDDPTKYKQVFGDNSPYRIKLAPKAKIQQELEGRMEAAKFGKPYIPTGVKGEALYRKKGPRKLKSRVIVPKLEESSSSSSSYYKSRFKGD